MDKNELMPLIGRNIWSARERTGMTQAELAEKIGISATHLGHVELGQKIMSVPTLYAAAEVLNISFAELVTPKGKSAPIQNIIAMLSTTPESFQENVEVVVRAMIESFGRSAKA